MRRITGIVLFSAAVVTGGRPAAAGERRAAEGTPAAPVAWGKPVGGLACAISSFDPTILVGAPYRVEVSIKNVSKKDVAVLKRACVYESGLARLFLAGNGKRYHESFPWPDASSSEPRVVTARDLVVLKPKQVYRFTHWTRFLARGEGALPGLGHFPVLDPGAYQMHYRYEASYHRAAGKLDLGGLTPWKGALRSAPVKVKVESLTRQATVSRLIEALKKAGDAEERKVLMLGISNATCKHFGANDGGAACLRALEAWWAANKSRSWEEWVVAGLESADTRDNCMAAAYAHLVKHERFRKRLLKTLDPARPAASDKVFAALWANFKDTEALDYARNVLKGGTEPRKVVMLSIIRRHGIAPLYADVVARLKSETDRTALYHLIDTMWMAKIKESIPVLEELMRRDGFPLRPRLIIALSDLKGAAYDDRLLEHLRSKDAAERRWAAWCLHRSGSQRAVEPLIAALKDENAEVIHSAMFSIRHLARKVSDEQARAAGPLLIDLMAEDHRLNVYNIHNALVRLGIIVRPRARPPNGPHGPDRKAARRQCAQAWRKWWRIPTRNRQ